MIDRFLFGKLRAERESAIPLLDRIAFYYHTEV
jgi:hypothetical protein